MTLGWPQAGERRGGGRLAGTMGKLVLALLLWIGLSVAAFVLTTVVLTRLARGAERNRASVALYHTWRSPQRLRPSDAWGQR
jgi:hypothetical protein